MATSVTVTENGATDDDPKFMPGEGLRRWGRTMHVRTMEANEEGNVVKEVVIVKTDIDAPTATPFADVDDQGLNTNPKIAERSERGDLPVSHDQGQRTSANVGMVGTGVLRNSPQAASQELIRPVR